MKKIITFLMTLCMTFGILSVSAADTTAYITAKVSGSYYQSEAVQVQKLVNAERTKRGLSPLKWDTTLEQAAMLRAVETSIKFSHTRPDGTAWNKVNDSAMSKRFRTTGENLAAGSKTPQEAVKGWMNSSGHRANILNKNFTHIGIASVNVNGVFYWVQSFGGGNYGVTSAVKTDKDFSVSVKVKKANTKFLFANSTATWNQNLTAYSKISVGKTQDLKVLAYDTKDKFVPATLTKSQFTFKSSDNSVLTISGNGQVKGIKAGTAYIYATGKDNKSFEIKQKITVVK